MDHLDPEQKKDIGERVEKANAYLKQAGLIVEAAVQKVNVGEGMFLDKVIPYLQDTRFSKKPTDEAAKKD